MISRTLDAYAYEHGTRLDFIRSGDPVENAFIESFNGRLRGECLNVNLFFTLADARQKIEAWRKDFNHDRPHRALGILAPLATRQNTEKTGFVTRLLSNPE